MVRKSTLALYDPRNGDVSLVVEELPGAAALAAPQRTNYFGVYWVQQGDGVFCADRGDYPFRSNAMLFVSPYQSFRFATEGEVSGWSLKFHANFLCLETHHAEVGCNGVLFHNVYGVPRVQLEEQHAVEFSGLLQEIQRELREGGLAHSEALQSYLKILLIRATRIKLDQQAIERVPDTTRVAALDELRNLIEQHFRTRHSPADYAALLHLHPKSLNRLVKQHWSRTLTDVIHERICRQAKWELLHTTKPVKQVAAELGFSDAYYFSRFFKRAAGCSPLFFRQFETTIREGRNLSME